MRFALTIAILATVAANLPCMADTSSPPTYSSEATAKRYCGTDTVVWSNIETHVYHLAGTQYYGRTKNGVYMCQTAAMRGGYRQSAGGN